MSTIKPTVGRLLYFYPNQQEEKGFRLEPSQPCVAIILFVHDDTHVNALVYTHEGLPCLQFKCRLLQAGDETPPVTERYLDWMPYQKDVAAGVRKPVLHASLEPEKPREAPAPVDTTAPVLDPDGLGD